MTYINYKNNQYKLIKGPYGGKYINVNGKKIYMDENKIKKYIVKKNIIKKNITKKNVKTEHLKHIINNLEVVIMNDTKIVRKIIKNVEIKDGNYILPNNYYSKNYYERLTGFKWNNLDWA